MLARKAKGMRVTPVPVLNGAGNGEGLSEHLLAADVWGWLWAKAFKNE